MQISLTQEQRQELIAYRSSACSENAERALMVLMNADGTSAPEIARQLRRHPHTVRDWLGRYANKGISGLDRLYAPGKTKELRQKVGEAIEEAMEHPPSDYKYSTALWTASLLVDWLQRYKSIKTSQDTVERALKEKGFRFRRSATAVPSHAPSKEEKLVAVGKIIEEIKSAVDNKNCTVLALDEAHFSTMPYVLSGWQKKIWPNKDSDAKEERTCDNIWLLEFGDTKVLLEKCRKR